MKALVLLTALTFSTLALAGGDHPAVSIPKELEFMKQLIGTWEGTTQMSGSEQTITVVYSATSGGTAITERLMADTPHEMISVYHKDGDSVAMTHYCSLGNQPHMKLKSSDGKVMHFEMGKPAGINSRKEPHMHAATLALTDATHLQQDWVYYKDGKPSETVTFTLEKKI